MALQCPHCHKGEFSVWSAMWKGWSNRDSPLECPHCGKFSTLDGRSASIANVLMVGTMLGSVFGLMSYLGYTEDNKITVVAFALALSGIVRYLSVKHFGVLIQCKSSAREESADRRESLLLSGVGSELTRLRDNKKADFTILYEPKDNRYVSLYCRKGMFVIELAFLPEEVEEKFGGKFKHALANAGLKPRVFDTKGVRGLESDLGSELEVASTKVQKIFGEVFGLKPQDKVLITRD